MDTSFDMFSLFPEEISLTILEFVDIEGVVSFGETSKTWNAFVKRNSKFLHKKVTFPDELPLRLSEKLELWGKRRGYYHVDPLGKFQGEARVSGNNYNFLDGELHGPNKYYKYVCGNAVGNEVMFNKGILHGTTKKEIKGFGKRKHVQTEEWQNGVLASREINKDGRVFVLCGSDVCATTNRVVEKYTDKEKIFLRCACHGRGLPHIL
nr:F-box containing protein [Marseillevirus futianmevirus]